MASGDTAKPHDRVYLYVDGSVVDELELRAKNSDVTLEELVDSMFPDDLELQVPPRRIPGPKPGSARPEAPGAQIGPVFCSCCAPGACRVQWRWRSKLRCGCTTDRLAIINAGGKLDD